MTEITRVEVMPWPRGLGLTGDKRAVVVVVVVVAVEVVLLQTPHHCKATAFNVGDGSEAARRVA